jgi:hypothetical protein
VVAAVFAGSEDEGEEAASGAPPDGNSNNAEGEGEGEGDGAPSSDPTG